MAADDGLLAAGAQVVIAAHALVAGHATAAEPAQADRVTDLEVGDVVADLGDGADDFMTRHQWIAAVMPIVVQHGEIGMADAAGDDVDLHLIWFQCARIVLEGGEFALGFMGGVGSNHGCFSEVG